MADEVNEGEGEGGGSQGPASEVVAEARRLGWVPQEEFRGDKSRWIDADVFVERGHQIMPILRQNNAALQTKLDQQARQLAEANAAIAALHESTAQIVKDRLAAERKEIARQLKEARDSNDVEAELELTEQLAGIREAEKKTAAPPPPAPATQPPLDPAFVAWKEQPENAWFGVDKRRTSLAIAIAQELRADPANRGLTGVAFYQKVTDEVNSTLKPASAPPPDRTGGGRHSSGAGGGTSGNGQSYNDLPPEAKAACDKQAKQFAGTAAFKTVEDYRKHYTKLYFA